MLPVYPYLAMYTIGVPHWKKKKSLSDTKYFFDLAKSASDRAYAPHSKFNVGAVVVTKEGKTFSGCNVENASFGLSMCAERNAIFQMVAAGFSSRNEVSTVFIYTTDNDLGVPTPPCGACRQVIFEFGKDVEIHSLTQSGSTKSWTIQQLLPDAFGPENIGGHADS